MKLDPVPNVVRPRDAPCIVALLALLACSENVCGEPGIRRSSATLQAARPSTGATNEPRSPLAAMNRKSRHVGLRRLYGSSDWRHFQRRFDIALQPRIHRRRIDVVYRRVL